MKIRLAVTLALSNAESAGNKEKDDEVVTRPLQLILLRTSIIVST
ncbi:MAG: hypothetical protein WB660_14050 [Candidatus Sulfotelmatobacter sp.]